VVEGRIEGHIHLESHLTVEESGPSRPMSRPPWRPSRAKCAVPWWRRAPPCLHATARVAGKVKAPSITIEDGARFSGEIEMDVELPAGVVPGNA
jgi:cytoskeletal protein CcmA (bactofilin family)